MAPTATTPMTTPAAMPALLGPPDDGVFVVVTIVSCALVWPGAVTIIVLAFVTTDGDTFWVGDGVACTASGEDVGALLALDSELDCESDSLPTLSFSPVSCTDHASEPPPVARSVCRT